MTKPAKRTTKKAKPDGMSGDKLKANIEKIYGNDQSQGAFSRLIGVHDRTVRAWIGGRFPVPRYIAMLVNLMIATETSPEDLKP